MKIETKMKLTWHKFLAAKEELKCALNKMEFCMRKMYEYAPIDSSNCTKTQGEQDEV